MGKLLEQRLGMFVEWGSGRGEIGLGAGGWRRKPGLQLGFKDFQMSTFAFVGFLKELRAFFLCKQWRTRKLWVGVRRRYD